MSPGLSIIIPTFKRKDSLLRLLQALLAQKEVVPEIIVVDQNPVGFLQEILPAAPAIRHLILPKPNASDARNSGFLASSGEIILFIDDDLIPEADFCIRALELFQSYPAVECFSPLVYNMEGPDIALQQAKTKSIGSLDESSGIFAMTDTISAAIFFRREYYRRTGGFDPMLFEFAKTAEDQEFFLRMRKRKMTLYFVPAISVYHDEKVPGGCDLRTDDYWITREKCMKAWAYRYRIHHHPPGSLALGDVLQLARSGFLNREVLLSGRKDLSRQIKLLKSSVRASREYLHARLDRYSNVEEINHLAG